MKTIPPSCPEPETGPKYWRSLDQLSDAPEFRQWLEREFPEGASELSDPVSRRHFMRIMSASFILAGVGASGCRRPEEKILPFSKKPEYFAHGVAQWYATAFPTRGMAIPLVARSDDGRPTKVEGNALHPDSNGGTDAFAQASILNLYDPDRSTRFLRGGKTARRDEAIEGLRQLSERLRGTRGRGLAVLVGRSSSPSRARVLGALSQALPEARVFVHEPLDFSMHGTGASMAFGVPCQPYHHLDKAKVILSLDCDFLGAEELAYQHVRGFARGRKTRTAADGMNRLYLAEALYSLTGANADHRLRLPASQVQALGARIALEVLRQVGVTGMDSVLQPLAAGTEAQAKWASECAADLLAHRGEALVMAGYQQPLAVHLIAQAMNSALGALDRTLTLVAPPDLGVSQLGTIEQLAEALNGGAVETLAMLDVNPAYDAPADVGWKAAQAKAKTVVRLAYYEDETSEGCTWQVPAAHYLESWGDARTSDGTLVPVQPLIAPLFGGMTELEFLARVAGLPQTDPHEIVRATFRALAGEGEDRWEKFLHDGFVVGAGAGPVQGRFAAAVVAQALGSSAPSPAPGRDRLELVFHRSASVDDGRYANNGWLQETPDPVTKITWDNVVQVSPRTAAELGFGGVQQASKGRFTTRVVEVTAGGRTVRGALWVQPGLADHVVGLALGYGREKAGRVARLQSGQPSGYNAYAVRGSKALHIAGGATLKATTEEYPVACTQEHGAMEGRPIIREANLEQYRKTPDFARRMDLEHPTANGQPVHGSLYPNPLDAAQEKAVHQWGMVIDLSSCVGCTACIVACQSENNVPIVGKDQVMRGREMSWIRLDRYFTGSVDAPQIAFQPMLCQHCESAPCESVCPVNATAHSEEGLNVMAYNRCVGTRYCSNNCPYKVRRFNFLDYNRRPLDRLVGPFYSTPVASRTDGEWELLRWFKNPDRGLRPDAEWELMKLGKNPDVTVRMRGVMEKCSFCIQRIERARIDQKVKAGASAQVEIPEGTIRTACQQACPAEAIAFGNMKDPQSQVSQLKAQDRNYSVLEFLLTKPRTTYLARLRNPNSKMPDAGEMPSSMSEWQGRGNSLEGHGHAGAGAHGTGAAQSGTGGHH